MGDAAGTTTTTTDTGTTGTTGATTDGTAQTGATTTDAGTTQTSTTDTGTTTATTAADTTATDWRSSITDPEALEIAKRTTTVADLAKVAVDLRKKNGSMINVPGKDAKPEDIAKFNKAIGVPETVDGYKFDIGREPTEQDKAIQGELAKAALAAGVPASAMTALSKAVTDLATAQSAERDRVAIQAREATEASLKKEWGADYEPNINLAKRAVSAFAEVKTHPEALDFFDKTMVNGQKLGDHPVILRMFGNIGRRMGEGEFIGAVGAGERQSLADERATLMRDNPPGTEKYKNPTVQKRLGEIATALAGDGPIAGRAS